MKKIFLFLIFTPIVLLAQPTPPPPTENDFPGGGTVAPGYPIDNTSIPLLLSLFVCIVIFFYYKKINFNK